MMRVKRIRLVSEDDAFFICTQLSLRLPDIEKKKAWLRTRNSPSAKHLLESQTAEERRIKAIISSLEQG
jgi:hypothetical protein